MDGAPPGKLPRVFYATAAALVPWTIFLAVALPRHYSAHHYWLGWVGFDIVLVVVLVMTGRSLSRADGAAARYAVIAATMLVIDAWFDVLNASSGTDLVTAGGAALLVELPLAVVLWQVARGRWSPNR